MVQWLRLMLPMKGTQVQYLVGELRSSDGQKEKKKKKDNDKYNSLCYIVSPCCLLSEKQFACMYVKLSHFAVYLKLTILYFFNVYWGKKDYNVISATDKRHLCPINFTFT